MAEFFDVMVEMNRMHNDYDDCDDGCPLHDKGFCNKPTCEVDEEDIKEAEKIIIKWSKEHPVVYPTWLEWMKSMGVIPYMMGLVTVRDEDGAFCDGHVNITEKALKPIPADIAEELGIGPKGR